MIFIFIVCSINTPPHQNQMAIWHTSPHGGKFIKIFIATIIKKISDDEISRVHVSTHLSIESSKKELDRAVEKLPEEFDKENLTKMISNLNSNEEIVCDVYPEIVISIHEGFMRTHESVFKNKK